MSRAISSAAAEIEKNMHRDNETKQDWNSESWKDKDWKDQQSWNNDWQDKAWKDGAAKQDQDWKSKSWSDWGDGKDNTWKQKDWSQSASQNGKWASGEVEMCGDFKRGVCQRGDRCRYSHGATGSADGEEEKQSWQDKTWKGKSWGNRDQGKYGNDQYGNEWHYDKKEKKEKKDRKEKKEKKEKKGKWDAPEKTYGELWEEPRENIGLSLIKELAPEFDWQYPLWDDSRRSYAGFLSNPWSEEECDTMFETIRDGTPWVQPRSGKALMPRKTAWMVKQGCSCTYKYGPFEVDAVEFPPWMIDLLGDIMPKCGLEYEQWPDSCNLNLYEDGGAAVGWHADDEALFQGKFRDIMIISLSLGVARKFDLRYNWPEATDKEIHTMKLKSGDLMTMEGMVQKHLQHRVPKEGHVEGPRINLTWRWVVKHTPKCPAGRQRR